MYARHENLKVENLEIYHAVAFFPCFFSQVKNLSNVFVYGNDHEHEHFKI